MLIHRGNLYSNIYPTTSSTLLLVFLIVAIIVPHQAKAYYMNGNLAILAGPDGDAVRRSIPSTPVTILSDTGISSGSYGAYAEGAYFGNLTRGFLGNFISGNSDPRGSGLRLESAVGFADGLTFTVPAGSYSSDIYVSINGFINGALAASGCSDSGVCAFVHELLHLRLEGNLGSDYYIEGWKADPDSSPQTISENITLTAQILRAGTYTEEQNAYLTVSASLLGTGHHPLVGTAPSTTFLIDFYNTAGFTSIITPEGVTWTSDSGVFLTQPIPLPGAIWLFCTGLFGSGLLGFEEKV